jgi:hypothetical protein
MTGGHGIIPSSVETLAAAMDQHRAMLCVNPAGEINFVVVCGRSRNGGWWKMQKDSPNSSLKQGGFPGHES